tara:strand:- start:10790 stop:11716 length:927 start_codon:yes stop_codon:yes gene_type:complete
MRKAFLNGMLGLAEQDERVVLIASDITQATAIRNFRDTYPKRFFMDGIYEQHLIGMAAGMAFSGKIPFVTTISTFLTRRCFEQVAIDVCMHNLPVRLFGTGGGGVYAPLGSTHMAIEDMAIMSALPNMTVIAPADANEMERLLPSTLTHEGPIYVRLAKGGDPIVTADAGPFEIGKGFKLREGGDLLLVTTGVTTNRALAAAEELAAGGIEACVLHMPTIKPLDTDMIRACAAETPAVLTVEEGTLQGGLGSATAVVLAEAGYDTPKRFARLGFPDVFAEHFGGQDPIMSEYGFDAPGIVARARALLG